MQAVSDFPAAIFAEEFVRAYPDAKVILSTRDEDAWYKSMMATLIHAYDHAPAGSTTSMRLLAEKYHKHMWKTDFPNHGRKAYRRHNEVVREIVKQHGAKFLEYNVGEGWQPLCQFLGFEVPEKSFPREDDWLEYKNAHRAEA